MPKDYLLHITGYVTLTFDDEDPIPQTPQAVQQLFENENISVYDLEKLTLHLTAKTPDEIATDEAEFQRIVAYARDVGERLRQEHMRQQQGP